MISKIGTLPHRIPLIRFKPKQLFKRQKKAEKEAGAKRKKAGISYDLGRGRTIFRDAFFARVYGKGGRESGIEAGHEGHLGIFVRSGRKNKKGRETIEEKFGPSITHVFAGEPDDIVDEAVALANEMLPKEVDTQLALVLRGKQLRGVG